MDAYSIFQTTSTPHPDFDSGDIDMDLNLLGLREKHLGDFWEKFYKGTLTAGDWEVVGDMLDAHNINPTAYFGAVEENINIVVARQIPVVDYGDFSCL